MKNKKNKKISMGTVQNGWLIVARVQAATLNIVLTILHQVSGWSKEGLEQFEHEYTMAMRRLRDPGETGRMMRQAIEETKSRMELKLNVNRDIPETRETMLIEKTWRDCLMIALTVLKQCNTTDALRAVMDHFSDFTDALTDSRHRAFQGAVLTNTIKASEDTEAYDRQIASMELLNETMAFLGKGGTPNEKKDCVLR